eukprot:scaffold39879_cov16-Tisochrysis_lutea.AAC.1
MKARQVGGGKGQVACIWQGVASPSEEGTPSRWEFGADRLHKARSSRRSRGRRCKLFWIKSWSPALESAASVLAGYLLVRKQSLEWHFGSTNLNHSCRLQIY